VKYVGSKARHAHAIIGTINDLTKGYDTWVEPFVGGCNSIDKVSPTVRRIGADNNPHLIAMWKALQGGWVPPQNITEAEYREIRDNPARFPPELYAFVAIGCSYSGKWWGGYARGNAANGTHRNYCLESYTNVMQQVPKLQGIQFYCEDYQALEIPTGSVIYCDPPYNDTTRYRESFDSEAFWNWCKEMHYRGNHVYVSEYTAPSDWRCVWMTHTSSSLTADTGSKSAIEKLYCWR
jgi:DNA adenine methylase